MSATEEDDQEATQLDEIPSALRDANILIIDDEGFNILVVRRFLQLVGYRRFTTLTDSANRPSIESTTVRRI